MLEMRSVSFAYEGAGLALEDVSLTVEEGERVAVLGHNGSGKSTLVKVLGALQNPLRGACFLSGRDVRDIPFRELRGQMGILFQDPENQIVAAVVEDDVAFAPENQGLPPAEIGERVTWALEKVGMLHKRRSLVSALSGGEKQRVALAGVLAARVRCLLLDEPTAMLDPEGRAGVERVLRSLHKSGVTLVQVTHQLENFDDMDRVIVLSGGHLTWQGSVKEFWPLAEGMGFEPPSPDLSSVPLAPERDFPEKPFIQVENLSFHFDGPEGGIPALTDVSAGFPRGGWVSVVGRTGSGKSTLVQHLNGLYRIQEGEIRIEGAPLPQKGEALHALRQRVGLAFQCPEDQIFCPTVREELAFAPANAGLSGEALKNAVCGALELVGLDFSFLDRNPLALSGGERRLVAIAASVLSAGPECLVLDEPIAGLDASYRKKILALLSRLRNEGKTIITITHDLNMALRYSDRILVLDAGRVTGDGSPRGVLPVLMKALGSKGEV